MGVTPFISMGSLGELNTITLCDVSVWAQTVQNLQGSSVVHHKLHLSSFTS